MWVCVCVCACVCVCVCVCVCSLSWHWVHTTADDSTTEKVVMSHFYSVYGETQTFLETFPSCWLLLWFCFENERLKARPMFHTEKKKKIKIVPAGVIAGFLPLENGDIVKHNVQYSPVQFSPFTDWVVGETWWAIQWRSFPVFSAWSYRELFWHGQGRPLYDFVHPAFYLPTTASPTLQGFPEHDFVAKIQSSIRTTTTNKQKLNFFFKVNFCIVCVSHH